MNFFAETISPASYAAAIAASNYAVRRFNRMSRAHAALKGQTCEDNIERSAQALSNADRQASAAQMEAWFQYEVLTARATA